MKFGRISFPRPQLLTRRFLLFLAIMGPGIITAFADNDSGGIATYSIAGAKYGYKFLWVAIAIVIPLAIIQEMAARMGAVTGKGLAALVREQFGLKLTFFCMLTLLVANVAVTTAEFAGIAASLEIFGIAKWISVPVMALIVWLLVVRGSYRSVEKIFLSFCLVYFTYVVSGFLARPDWLHVFKSTVTPSFAFTTDYILLFIAFVGTTITPWMQFFIQANVVDKGITVKEYSYTRLDVITGAFFTEFIVFFIILATASTLYKAGIPIHGAAEAAIALKPLAGQYASTLFAIGLFNASLLAAFILPLSTSYAICEAFGWEAGIDRSFSKAPIFNGIYTFTIVIGALIILLVPEGSLFFVMLLSQEINGILLPIILIFMLIIINDKDVMGKYVNGKVYNIIVWSMTIVMILLSVMVVLIPLIEKISSK